MLITRDKSTNCYVSSKVKYLGVDLECEVNTGKKTAETVHDDELWQMLANGLAAPLDDKFRLYSQDI